MRLRCICFEFDQSRSKSSADKNYFLGGHKQIVKNWWHVLQQCQIQTLLPGLNPRPLPSNDIDCRNFPRTLSSFNVSIYYKWKNEWKKLFFVLFLLRCKAPIKSDNKWVNLFKDVWRCCKILFVLLLTMNFTNIFSYIYNCKKNFLLTVFIVDNQLYCCNELF